MDTAFLVTAFVALFVIIDPIGMTPLFVALTQGMSTARRRAIAIRACVAGALLIVLFAAFGEQVLGFIGISMPAFRIAGGILLFLTALDMLFERRGARRKGQADAAEEDEGDDPSIFPLAIPLIAGPGSITTVILLVGDKPGLEGLAMVIAVMLSVIALALVMFLMGGLLERALGARGHQRGHAASGHAARGARGAIRARRAARVWVGGLRDHIPRMESFDFPRLVYLSILGSVLVLWFVVQGRQSMGKLLQYAAAWALIFLGAIAVVGLWQDIRQTVRPTQSVVSEGRVELPRAPDGHYYVTAEVNGTPLRFVVDTGASQIVLSRRDAARAGIDTERLVYTGRAQTANGTVRTAPVRLDRVSIGPIADRDVRAVVNEGAMSGSLLGMDYLRRFSSVEITGDKLVLTR